MSQTTSIAAKVAWSALRQNAPELPETHYLQPRHIAHLEKDGIDELTALNAGIFSATPELAEELTGHCKAGIIFSYFDITGTHIYRYGESNKPFFRLKPDNPAGPNKYLSPKGAGSFIYYPRTVGFSFSKIGGKNLLLSEGEKKALCSTINGLPCIGLGGVTSHKTGAKDADGNKALGSLVDEINLFEVQSLTVCFDSDIVYKPQVAGAIASLTYDLLNAYKKKELATSENPKSRPTRTMALAKKLKFALLPNLLSLGNNHGDPDDKQKLGIDDAIVLFGAAKVRQLIDSALPLAYTKFEDGILDIQCLFTSEPCGDDASKHLPKERQRHHRSLMATLAATHTYINVIELGYHQYSQTDGIWKPISAEEWALIDEDIANAQGWFNRRADLMAQHRKSLSSSLKIKANQLDPTNLMGFTNGVLNLETMRLMPFSPTHYLTQRLNFAYDPEASCNTWLSWLDWVFEGDEVKIELIQALFRWTLEPKKNDQSYPVQIAPIAIGESGYGKGTFLQVLKNMLGEQSCKTWNYSALKDADAMAQLVNKRAAIADELKGRMTNGMIEALNRIVSNETVNVWIKYRNKESLRLNTILWGAMNRPIESNVGDRDGLNRRVLYLPFNRKPEKVDPQLGGKLAANNAGIFNWVWALPIDDAIARINGYLPSDDNVQVQSQYLEASNSVYEWLQAMNLEMSQTRLISEWFRTYRAYCDENLISPLGNRNWKTEMIHGGATVQQRRADGIPLTVPALADTNTRRMLGIPKA